MQPRDCIRKVGGAASIRVSLPPWSGADGGGRQIRTLGIYANKETRRALATMNLTEPKKHSEEDRGSHASFEKAANLIVKRVERQAPPLRRRRFVDIRCFRPGADGAAQFWIAADEIDRLVLGAEGRRAVLHSQFAVQLDDVGERLCAEFRVFSW